MKKKIGEWLMDVSKYVTTVFLISTYLGGIEVQWKLYVVGTLTAIVPLILGIALVREVTNKSKED
jgi:hypothetical protein